MMAYLLDADTLISAKRRRYLFSLSGVLGLAGLYALKRH